MPRTQGQLATLGNRSLLKVSRYAHVFHYPDGLILAYNSLFGNLLKLEGQSGSDIAAVLEGHTPSLNSPYQDDLIEAGFLLESDIDELNVVKEIWRKGRRKKGDVMLTILPTLSCNFRCPYCFERHTKGLMLAAVQDALVNFASRYLLPKSKELSIDWFGGEPLVGLSVMKSLTARLREACSAAGLPHPTGSVTTNGYLLDPAMYQQLMDLGIRSAQITIDGPPEIHNRRRPMVGGQPTFDHIIRNIQDVPEGFSLSIRINVDSGNVNHIFELIELLHREGILPRVTAYTGIVESFSEECRSSDGMFLTSEQYAKFKVDLNRQCEAAGIPWSSSESPRLVAYGYCIVDQPKGFVIQPDGKLLKCWAEAGNATARPVADLLQEDTWGPLFAKLPKNKCGSSSPRPEPVPTLQLVKINQVPGASPVRITPVSPLQSRDPFDDEECCECSLLPACMGGCPTIRENLRFQGVKRCPPLRYSLPEEVRALYVRQQSSGSDTPQTRRLQSI